MKKVIPVIVAIALIAIIFVTCFGKAVYDKYSYGQELADLNDYFQIFGEDDVPIILGNERAPESARIIDGIYYFDRATVEEHFTTRFYLDTNEGLVLYTSPETTYETVLESSEMHDVKSGESISFGFPTTILKEDILYIAVDFVRYFVDFDYEVFTEPNRMQVYTEWGTINTATIKSDTEVRWRGGVKSEILTEVKEGDKVTVIEEMDDWTKVKTADCYIGYVENFRLGNEKTEELTPATGALKENFSYLNRDYNINLTWHNIEYAQDGYDLMEALRNTRGVNVVSPTWYWLSDNEGGFMNVANSHYTETAHNNGMEVWALISNFHTGADVDTGEVLSYTSKRRTLETNLVASAVEFGADGINVDFENMDTATTPHFVQFVRELSVLAHEYNLVVSVDNYVPTEYTAHYNRTEQGKFADYIIIMGYDEHYAGDVETGSVSSIPWMTDGIEKTCKLLDSKRVINAVPFYTRVWMTDNGEVTSEAVTMQVAQDFISRNGITTTWDESTYQNYGEATLNGVLYQVWLEDADSLQVRLNVMRANNLGGIASWKLGQETPDVWGLIENYLNY